MWKQCQCQEQHVTVTVNLIKAWSKHYVNDATINIIWDNDVAENTTSIP
jgi:hypothetical protein